ncbi:MAG TPA: hypothetical protein VLR69_21435 [Thermoanaerobaculia bacterium]|nr:hypothetical protein [Thermoanaerobaculia bacterium]
MSTTKILGGALLATLAITLTAGQAAAADLWIHVKVDGHGTKDERVSINMPLSMVRNLSGMVPEDERHHGRMRIHDHDYDVSELRRAWREIERGPDANFITVKDPDSDVKIAKRGDHLEMRAVDRKGKREEVEARIPLQVVSALLSGEGDEVNLDAALDELSRHGQGEILTVHSEDETVRIWIDRDSEGR